MRDPKTTWRKLIEHEMQRCGETWDDVESHVVGMTGRDYMDDDERQQGTLDYEFDAGYGGHNGPPFTLWTKARAYFPVVYDGAEWVGSVPRNPCEEASEHVGGE